MLQTDHCIRRVIDNCLLDEMLDTLPCQPRSLDPIERRRIAALLDVAEDCLAGIEQTLTFAFEEGLDEVRGVDLVRVFVADDETEPFAVFEPVLQGVEIDLEVM